MVRSVGRSVGRLFLRSFLPFDGWIFHDLMIYWWRVSRSTLGAKENRFKIIKCLFVSLSEPINGTPGFSLCVCVYTVYIYVCVRWRRHCPRRWQNRWLTTSFKLFGIHFSDILLIFQSFTYNNETRWQVIYCLQLSSSSWGSNSTRTHTPTTIFSSSINNINYKHHKNNNMYVICIC